ncbi:MAG: hypothetical protein IPL59_01095 [Candidatus Competibacteraceae bacterium]|nr:hypothetical protein [Candidatus Competibacteraceae bacterium]
MVMRYLPSGFSPVALLSALLWWSPASATKPVPDEFVAPLQATAATPMHAPPKGAGRVRTVKDDKMGMPVLQARTAQEAIAAAVAQHAAGCRMLRFSSDGFGWIVTGAANYAATENPVAVRRGRQEARFKAFVDARTRLAECLRGLPPETRQQISERLAQDDAIRLALINLAANDEERREQALRILARGFVAYAVNDDSATVRVHLVTTPRTATRLTRPTANAVEAISLPEGLNQMLAEAGGGLIPPVGNRLIVVNATGELALVGYAINLIGVHPDPAAQSKLRTDAEKIATRHATEALTGLATDDAGAWQSGLDEASRDEIRTAANGYEDGEPSVRRFGQIRDLMMASIKDDPGFQTVREGSLPSATMVKRFSSDETVAVVVVYTPPVKKREVIPPAQQQPTAPATAPASTTRALPAPLPDAPAAPASDTPAIQSTPMDKP